MPIQMLGRLGLTSSDDETITLPTRKTLLVLVVLALSGERGNRREALAELLWPDRAEGQARSSLRQALTAVRKALGDIGKGLAIEVDGDVLRLSGGSEHVDVWHFAALAEESKRDDLAVAADCYQGDLLADVALEEPLGAWVASEREQLRQKAITLVEELSKQVGPQGGELKACEALATRLLSGDAALEAAHRAIIRLRLVQGQRNAALRQLQRCREATIAEFGTEPEDLTSALLQAPDATTADVVKQLIASSDMRAPASTQLPASDRARPSVVVMPFDDLGPAGDDFFADGVVEEITSALSRIKDFFVIARQSAFTYKGRFVDVGEVGRDLGVRYAVEGTVRRGGDKVRITVQLVETETRVQLWSDRYEGNTKDIFELQDRIASHVAGAINPSIRASEIELARRTPPENLQAYDYALRAFPHFWAHRKEDNEKALELFDEALARDPNYGVALAFKAWCHAQQACYLWAENPGEERARAIETADMAALHLTDHATALTAIGAAYSITTTDYKLAESFISRSLALDPNNAWGWMRDAWLNVFFASADEAITKFNHALALSPFDPLTFNVYFGIASAHANKRDFATAIEFVERGLRAGPGVTWAYRLLASFHAMNGDKEKSEEALAKFLHHYPGMTIKKMKEGMPPAVTVRIPDYWTRVRKTGIPEE